LFSKSRKSRKKIKQSLEVYPQSQKLNLAQTNPIKMHRLRERESTNRAPETENAGEGWPGGGWPTAERQPTPPRKLVALGFGGEEYLGERLLL